MKHYGTDNIPPEKQLWAMDWFRPSCRFEENLPLTSIIILTCNQLDYTRQCLNSIFACTGSPFELIIVDNGSRDGTMGYLSSLSRSNSACLRIKLIANEENKGFAIGCNQGLAEAHGEYLLLLNNDVVVTAGWLSRLAGALQNNDCLGFVGPMSNYVSGPQWVSKPSYNVRTLEGLDRFAAVMANQYRGQVIPCSRIVGFCMLIKKAVVDAIGGLDGRYGLGNFEDDDYCLRANLAGYKGGISKDCFVHHFGGRTFFGNNLHYEKRLKQNWELFKEKWEIAPETKLGAKYQLRLPTTGFDPAEHFIPLYENSSETVPARQTPVCSEADVVVQGAEGRMSLKEYCLAMNGDSHWQWLHQLTEGSLTPPYMAILDDVLIFGPLMLHHRGNDQIHALDIENDSVSGNIGRAGSGHGAGKLLSECGPMRKGSYLILWGFRTDNFWHWTIEALSKVVMARACGFDGYYIVPPKFNCSGFIRDSLELMGITPDRVCVYDGRPLRVERIYLPQFIQGSHQLTEFPVVIDELRRVLLHSRMPTRYSFDRIYIARDDPKLNRRIVNETELLSLLFKYGFQRVVMEHFSLQEQISIANGANFIIAPHGAGAVHSMFMPGRSTFVELFPTTYVNPCMLPVIDRLRHRYFMVPSSHLGVMEQDNYEAPIYYLEVILKREIELGFEDSSQQ
jgi:GT2 family glycosyltransferase/capsular polysaccharide biosynthesis protein